MTFVLGFFAHHAQADEKIDTTIAADKDLEFEKVIRVDVNNDVSSDISEAWKHLAPFQRGNIWTDEQYDYAKDLLNKYQRATRIQKIIIWRVVYIRFNHYGPTGNVGPTEIQKKRREKFNEELTGVLYSALGKDAIGMNSAQARNLALKEIEQATNNSKEAQQAAPRNR